jgi:hypothetical protein
VATALCSFLSFATLWFKKLLKPDIKNPGFSSRLSFFPAVLHAVVSRFTNQQVPAENLCPSALSVSKLLLCGHSSSDSFGFTEIT